MATLYQVFKKQVRAIAGGFRSEETVNIQLISKTFMIPQISARANIDDLSDKANYPLFARMTMPDRMQDAAIVQLFEKMNWKRAILIYTNEQYGVSGNSLMLNTNIEISSVKITTTLGVSYNDSIAQIERFVQNDGIRIFLYFMLPPYFSAFMTALGNKYSSHDFAYVITAPVGSNMIEFPSMWLKIMPNIDGAFLITAAVGTGAIHDSEQEKWNNLNMSEYLGGRPESYSLWNWYDTIYVFAHALDAIMQQIGAKNDIAQLDSVTGPQYFEAIKRVDFVGAIGPVRFDSNADLIGNGGVWNLRNGKMPYIGTFYGNSSTLVLESDPIFFGGKTSIPFDSYQLPIVRVSVVIRITMYIFQAICVLITVVIGAFLVMRPMAFAKSGRFYCGIIIAGSFLALIAADIAVVEPTDTTCLVFPWFLGIGFIIVFGCLFLRTWALFQVFKSAEKMKKVNLSPLFIVKIVALFILIEVIFLVVWSVVDPPKLELITVRGNIHRQYRCGAGNIVFWAIFIGYKGIWMLFGAIIAFKIRNLRADYNQSVGLGMSVYNSFSVSVIAVVLGFVLDDIPDIIVIVEVIAILLIFTVPLILLFSRPVYCIIFNKPLEPEIDYNVTRGSPHSSNSPNPSAKSKDVELS